MEINSNQTVYTTNTQNESLTNKNTINIIKNSFNTILNENKESNTERLVADLKSLIRTGLTVSELERLEELLAQLSQLEKDGEDTAEASKEINNLLSTLEKELVALLKRLKGEAIIEGEEIVKNDNNNTSNKDTFESKIQTLKSIMADLQSGHLSGSEEGKLLEELRTDKKANLLDRLALDKNQDNMKLFNSMVEDKYIDNEKDENKKV